MKNLFAILLFSYTLSSFAQTDSALIKETKVDYKWRLSTTYLVPDEIAFGYGKRTSIQMVELHLKRTEYYDGFLRETGIGITYQRMLWKGLFATVEVLPQIQTYTDLDGNKIKNGFKVYNSYHLGYHASIGKKKRFFIEPQVHINQWFFDNNSPEGFKEFDDKYGNVFWFEPNLYFGVNF